MSISSAIINSIVANAIGPPGLPRNPAQNERHASPVNHFCARTLLSSFRRQSRGCFHSFNFSEMSSRASSEAWFVTPCFHGILGALSSDKCNASRICSLMSCSKNGSPKRPGCTLRCSLACAMRKSQNLDLPLLLVSAASAASSCRRAAYSAATVSRFAPNPHSVHGSGTSLPFGGL